MGYWLADLVVYPLDTVATRIKANKTADDTLI
jgi:hypothetical protein